jgi:hypothetical protein
MSEIQGLGVHRAINAVQAELAAIGMSKDSFNQGQKYNFRGIDQAYNTVSAIMAKHGLCMYPSYRDVQRDERKSNNGGALFVTYVMGDFEFVCMEDGSSKTVSFPGEAMDSADKSSNKALSASHKYALIQTFLIPTEGDNDADASHYDVAPRQQQNRAPAARGAAPSPTEEARNAINYILEHLEQDKPAELETALLEMPKYGGSKLDEVAKDYSKLKAYWTWLHNTYMA